MKLKDFKRLNENWSQWAGQGHPSGSRGDLYDAIREYSKELTGSRETYGDFDKLDSMSDEQLEEYYAGMKNSPEAQAVVDDAAAEEEAAMGVDTEYDKMPSQSGMGRGMRESAGGKLQYSVSNTGYGDVYQFFDQSGEEVEQTLGMMVLDLADAGVGGWAPEEQIDRMMTVNADPNKNQGGMQKWDSNVFEDYYGADNQKILQAWAKMSGVELEQMPEAEDEYEDDGTNDFEEYYSESKKRNKIHEASGADEMQLIEELVEFLEQKGALAGSGIDTYGAAYQYLEAAVMPTLEMMSADNSQGYSHLAERIKRTVVRKLKERKQR